MKPKLSPLPHPVREAWLNAALANLRPMFESAGYPLPAKVRITCGWPSAGGRGGQRRVIGQCWDSKASADGHFEVFISPTIATSAEVLPVLVHELIHAAVGLECGHRKPFSTVHPLMGLMGKPTQSEPSPDFVERYAAITTQLGTYPHAKLDPTRSGATKQANRSLRCTCPACGWKFRASQSWIDQGLPTCVCGNAFVATEGPAAEEDAE